MVLGSSDHNLRRSTKIIRKSCIGENVIGCIFYAIFLKFQIRKLCNWINWVWSLDFLFWLWRRYLLQRTLGFIVAIFNSYTPADFLRDLECSIGNKMVWKSIKFIIYRGYLWKPIQYLRKRSINYSSNKSMLISAEWELLCSFSYSTNRNMMSI